MIVVGVDGCKRGWVSAAWHTGKRSIELAVHPTFADVLGAFPEKQVKAIAVDIPIGLIECSRACDREARSEMGCRASSVFPAPDPRVVCMTDYHAASSRLRELCGKGISAQGFGIYPKVCEVDRCLTPGLQDRIIEVHPEVCFWAMNGREPVCPSKKTDEGFEIRLDLLDKALDLRALGWYTLGGGKRGAARDDVLDAVAAAWTARRWVNGSFGRFPELPEIDRRGLRAEIVY